MDDSHVISILKSFSWRIIGTITSGILAYLLTGNLKISFAVGGIDFFIKIFLYYGHERFWEIKKVRRFFIRWVNIRNNKA